MKTALQKRQNLEDGVCVLLFVAQEEVPLHELKTDLLGISKTIEEMFDQEVLCLDCNSQLGEPILLN